MEYLRKTDDKRSNPTEKYKSNFKRENGWKISNTRKLIIYLFTY